jgi:hypothetical protein
VYTGTALRNKGVQLVLDAVIDFLPSPQDVPAVMGESVKTGEEVPQETRDDAPFSALAFKVATDPFIGQLTFFRVYSGSLKAGSYVLNSSKNEKERVGRIVRMHANHREEIDDIHAGDIGALVGMKVTTTGNTLCDVDHPILLESITFPRTGYRHFHRTEDEARPGEDGCRFQEAFRGRSDLPCPYGRGDRTDDPFRHGRTAPRYHRRSHETRIQGGGQRRSSAGRVSRDDS